MSLVIERDAGSLTVPDATLRAIAVAAAESVEGVRVLRRRSVDLDAALVRLAVAAGGGEPLLSSGQAVQRAVADALERMCDLHAAVEVTIAELAP